MQARNGVAAALAALFIVAAPARAALFDDEVARQRIEDLRADTKARTGKLEAQLEQSQRTQLDLSNQIEALRGEIAKLRGQVEVLTYELEASTKRQKDFYLDLDTRLRALETKPVAAAEPEVDPAAEPRDYEAALNLLKGGKYAEAQLAFEAFIKSWPQSSFQPAAHYWAASAAFQTKAYSRAAELYREVHAQWPADVRAPEALIGLANTQQIQGDAKGAKKTLDMVIAQYPGTPSADVARQRIKQAAQKK
ncbi:tol-pal system protein YbgF [Methyloversatilis sp. NSM2]|uniref:tol-pal system protein YbgF n=1 Tax=Methyloversatilis sp. NSM2 TaxID=3134135 RepID=UPI0031144938